MANDARGPSAPAEHTVTQSENAPPSHDFTRYSRALIASAVVCVVAWILRDAELEVTLTPICGVIAIIALTVGGGPAVLATLVTSVILVVVVFPADTPNLATAISLFTASGLIVSGTAEALRRKRQARQTTAEHIAKALEVERIYVQSIVETLHEPLLVLHTDLTVKSVNPAFYSHFLVQPEDTIGHKIYELGNQQWDIPALRALLEDVLPTNKVFNDYEVILEFESIGRRVMLVNGRRLDHVQLILLGIRDITEHKQAEDTAQIIQEKQAFLLQLSDAIRTLSNAEEILLKSAQVLGQYLGANRVAYAEDCGDGQCYKVTRNYVNGVEEATGQFRYADFGSDILQQLQAGLPRVQPDIQNDKSLRDNEKQALARYGVGASLKVPLVKDGRLVAFLDVNYPTAHVFHPHEIDLVKEVADRSWAAVERAKAELALQRSHDTFFGLVHNAPFGVYVVDARFRLVEVSVGARKVFAGVEPLLGRDFADVLRSIWVEPFATEAIARFRHTLSSGEAYRSTDTTEQRHNVPDIESYDWRIERITMPDGSFGVVCYFYETTILKRAATRDAFRARLADTLRPLVDPDEMKQATCRLLIQHLATGRASYAEVEPDDTHVVIAAEATDQMASFAGRYRADAFGPTFINDLREGRNLVIDDVTSRAELTEAEQATYAAVSIRALVVVPLNKRGRWLAALGVNSAVPRKWTADEIALIEEVAERMWAAVERAKAETALRASAERLRLAVRASNIGLWDWDLKTDVVVYSPEWKAQLGYGDNEIWNEFSEWRSRLHPDDLTPTLDRIWNTIASTEPSLESEFRMQHKDGSWRWIYARAEVIRDTDGLAVRIIGGHLDVTSRKNVEQALREREAHLSAILDTAADALVTIDRAGIVESVNRAAERMFGYTAAELVGSNVKVLMPPPHRDRHDGYLTRYVSTNEPRIIGIDQELTALRKDGTTFPIELSVSEIDHLRQFTGIIRDVTRRKELEREVVEAASEEQRRIGQDLHDSVSQELTALTIQTDDLADAIQTDLAAAAGLVHRISQGLRRCQREIRTVIRGLMPVAVDAEGLMAALTDLADRTSREHNVTCTFDCPLAVKVVDNLTATQLYLIVQEAVHNSVKHARPRVIQIALTSRKGSGLKLQIIDDGCGMPEELPAGHGQGLRIMRHRSRIIGGRLAITAADPTGTVVTCKLGGGDN